MPHFEEHRSTGRVLDILELLAGAEGQGYTLTELAERVGAPKSSLFPIVHTMRVRRFLDYDEARGLYSIGLAAFAVGSAFVGSHNLLEHITGAMRSVALQCNETCQMGVRDHDRVLYVAKEDSPDPIQLISHVGKRLPLHCTALGKALLLDADAAELERLYPSSANMPAMTDKTLVSRDQLALQLEQMRAEDFTCEYGESNRDICCFGIPLRMRGKVAAALSVSVPTFRCDQQKIALVHGALTEARAAIESLLTQPEMARQFQSFLEQY